MPVLFVRCPPWTCAVGFVSAASFGGASGGARCFCPFLGSDPSRKSYSNCPDPECANLVTVPLFLRGNHSLALLPPTCTRWPHAQRLGSVLVKRSPHSVLGAPADGHQGAEGRGGLLTDTRSFCFWGTFFLKCKVETMTLVPRKVSRMGVLPGQQEAHAIGCGEALAPLPANWPQGVFGDVDFGDYLREVVSLVEICPLSRHRFVLSRVQVSHAPRPPSVSWFCRGCACAVLSLFPIARGNCREGTVNRFWIHLAASNLADVPYCFW